MIAFCDSPFAELVTWVGTIFGSVLISGANGDVWVIFFGALVVALAVAPLAIQGFRDRRVSKLDTTLDGREETAAAFAKLFIKRAIMFETAPRTLRIAESRDGVSQALDHLWQQYFSQSPRVRVVLFEFDGVSSIGVSKVHAPRGRSGGARPFSSNAAARYKLALEILNAPQGHKYVPQVTSLPAEWGANGRDYKTFITLPLRSDDTGLGLLAVDSSRSSDLSARDAEALEIYASAISFYLAAAKRGERKKEASDDDDSNSQA